MNSPGADVLVKAGKKGGIRHAVAKEADRGRGRIEICRPRLFILRRSQAGSRHHVASEKCKTRASNSGVSPRLLIVGGGAAACLFLVIVLIFALNRSSVRKPVRPADVAPAANAANPDVVDAQPKTSTSPVPPQNPIVWQESTRAPEAAGEPVHLLAAVPDRLETLSPATGNSSRRR